jgi:hypothetical protein
MSEEHERINARWSEAERVSKARVFVERSDVKAWAALSVGGTSLVAVWFDSRELKIAATALATLLPVVFLACIYATRGLFREIGEDLDVVIARRKGASKKSE